MRNFLLLVFVYKAVFLSRTLTTYRVAAMLSKLVSLELSHGDILRYGLYFVLASSLGLLYLQYVWQMQHNIATVVLEKIN